MRGGGILEQSYDRVNSEMWIYLRVIEFFIQGIRLIGFSIRMGCDGGV